MRRQLQQRKFIAILLVLAMIISLPGLSALANPGAAASEFHAAFMRGDTNGNFLPLDNALRSEAAALLVRTQIAEFEDGTLPAGMTEFDAFVDVLPGAWNFYYIAWAYDAGLVTGDLPAADGTRTFRPDAPISREEFAALIARTVDEVLTGEAPFADANQISAWARDYVWTAYQNGWIAGDLEGYFRPLNNLLRAEIATAVNRMLGRIDANGLLSVLVNPEDAREFPDVAEDAWYFASVVAATNDHLLTRDADGVIDWMKILTSTRVDILTFADFHGNVDSMMNDNDPGAARLVAYAEWLRQQNPNPENVIVVPGGDDFHGHPLSNYLRGEPAVAMMHQLGVEYMALGNHEFSFGFNRTLELAEEVTFLASDLFYSAQGEHPGTRPDWVEPYAIVEFEDGDVSVALVGLMTSGMSHLVADPAMANFEFRTPTIANADPAWITATEDLIDYVRDTYGVDAVVAVTHMYRAEAASLANLMTGFDAIIGGHGHGTYTDVINGTPIIEAGQHGRHMGRVSLYISPLGGLDDVTMWLSPAPPALASGDANVLSVRDFNRPAGMTFDGVAFPASQHPDFLVYPSIEEAYDTMAAIIAAFAAEAADYLDEVLGTRSIYSNVRTDRNVWVTRLVSDYVARSTGEDDWVYVSNFGGWRNVPPFQFGPETPVLMREMYATMPFNNTILLYEMYGRDLLTLLNMQASSDTSLDPPTFGLNGGQPPVVDGAFRGEAIDLDFMINGAPHPRWQWYLTATGEPISDDDTVYRVIGSNFTQGPAVALLPGGTPVGGGDRFPIPGTTHGNALGMTFLGMPQALMQDGSLVPWNEVPTDNTLWEVQGLRTLRSAMIAQQRYRGENPGYTAELTVAAIGSGTAVISAPFAPGDQSQNVNVVPQAVTVTAAGTNFLGWFEVDGTTPLSTDLVYTFVQRGPLALEARFA